VGSLEKFDGRMMDGGRFERGEGCGQHRKGMIGVLDVGMCRWILVKQQVLSQP